MDNEWGLEITNNSKVSWAFSVPPDRTCINSTGPCRKWCYGKGIRFRTPAQQAKQERNYRTIELLLKRGGPELVAQNLVALIDQARPADWLTARITGTKTKTSWSIRLHDVGDFDRVGYAQAWQIAVLQRPLCSFWFYTRSFLDKALFDAMTELASLPNCQGWLSIDSENYAAGLRAYAQEPRVWKLALMQQEPALMDKQLFSELAMVARAQEVVSFPVHRGSYHAEPIEHPALFTCPAVLGVYKLEPNPRKIRPCQACGFCLPDQVA